GCYLYEAGGSVHQFCTPADNTEDTDTFMMVTGSNLNFNHTGDKEYLGLMDAGLIKAWVDAAIPAQGLTQMRYIQAATPTYSR
ncbi:MAG TPA: 2,4'-dihydroxyacetophenone dioxygenase, partial [Burkholderiaceae bacterium]